MTPNAGDFILCRTQTRHGEQNSTTGSAIHTQSKDTKWDNSP